MFKEIKSIIINSKVIAVGLCLGLLSCSEADPDKIAAEDLLQRATAQMESGNALGALSFLDSIDVKYGSQVEVRKQATALRPHAMEKVLLTRIVQADSIIAEAELTVLDLTPKMKHVPGGDLEGYYIVNDAKGDFIKATGIEPRVNDENFMFYIVAQVKGKKIGINQLSLVGSSEEKKSEIIPSGSARVTSIEGSELASFLPEEVAALGEWSALNMPKGAMIYGNNGTQQVKLTPAQASAFSAAWRFADAKARLRQGRILREKLDRQLQVARDQIARTTQDDL